MANCAGVPNSWRPAMTVPPPVCAAFFRGQFPRLGSSRSIDALGAKAQAQGVTAEVFDYTEAAAVRTWLGERRGQGFPTAVVGYSLGCSAATEIQSKMMLDLVICIAESTLGENYPIDKHLTKRSVLYRGTDFLSSAGLHDGFDEVVNVTAGWGIPVWSHLCVPSQPIVINGVLAELAKLKGN